MVETEDLFAAGDAVVEGIWREGFMTRRPVTVEHGAAAAVPMSIECQGHTVDVTDGLRSRLHRRHRCRSAYARCAARVKGLPSMPHVEDHAASDRLLTAGAARVIALRA